MKIFNPERPLIKMAFIVPLWIVAFYPVWLELISAWRHHSNESYGMLVPIICLYFIWQKKDQLAKAEVVSSSKGLWLVLLSMIFYLLSYAGGVAFVSRLMSLSSLIGIVIYVYGRYIFNIISFPLIFCFFMIPIPYSVISLIALPLQLFATNISAFIIDSISIPVYQEGNMLYFAQTQLEVAEACSGLRSITALTMLSVLFAYLLECERWKKIFIVLSAIPIAIIVNIIRVSGTGILAHFYGGQVASGFLHDFSGIAVFILGLAILFIEAKILKLIGNKKFSNRHI